MSDQFLSLTRDGAVAPLNATPDFWERLMDGRTRIDGWLVSLIRLDGSFAHSERHPDGEEIVILREGGPVELSLDVPGGPRIERLTREHPVCIVPRDVWHVGRSEAPATLVFVTPAGGTDHRPLAEHP
jgi:hypothetical protein